MDPRIRITARFLLGAVFVASLTLPSAAPALGKGSRTRPRVVVAVIDTGFNPYHEYFHHGGPLYKDSVPSGVTPAILKEFGIDKDHIIRVTRTGNFASDFERDSEQFKNIRPGEPYWFEGTNVIGISFLPEGPYLRPDGTASPHGIGTAASVLTANPEAIVVAVEGINNDSEEWAFTHPSVDIVSTSYGPPTSAPILTHLSFSYEGVVENGKVHFGAAANDPTYSSLDSTSGPWWTIGIAGFEEDSSGGRQLLSGNVPDFVGDFHQELPYCRSCEEGLRVVGGTSFATPRSAGTFSKVLLEARRASRHAGGIVTPKKDPPRLVTGRYSLTNWKMRRGLEQAAYYPGTDDFGSQEPPEFGSVPVLGAAPWVQTGWGLVSPNPRYEVIDEMLARLGIAGKAERNKPQEACDFMTRNMQARRLYWDQLAVLGDSFGNTEDPYIYC